MTRKPRQKRSAQSVPGYGLRYLDQCIEQDSELRQYNQAMRSRLNSHGDVMKWESALDGLAQLNLTAQAIEYGPTVRASGTLSATQTTELTHRLQRLAPWRKGPFELFGVHIDSEWHSDWKWARLAPHLPELRDKRILDVGCGNGYYGWRMLAAGAGQVLGVDPTLLFLYQFLATARCIQGSDQTSPCHRVIPLRFEELKPRPAFDVIFSMGVLYHRRDPQAHLHALTQHLTKGGSLVLETLISRDGDIEPRGRYAQMRNVHCIPCIDRVISWLRDAGLVIDAPCDVTTTTVEEQRATQWMSFESLINTLDPMDPSRTIEGYPAPVRACFVAKLPR